MLVSLNLTDEPVGYSPPVGPSVDFAVTYNHREAFQPATFTYANFGSKWTCDWVSYITDDPQSPSADVNLYAPGGGTRTFTGFDTNTQTYGFEQYEQTRLTRTGSASYEMLEPDGSKLVFSQSDGSIGTSRKIFLTQMLDSFGNAVSLNYDGNLRLTSITDAIGQVTTLTYGLTNDTYKITRVTDPFGRFATFTYDGLGRLTNITDVIGLNSQFTYETNGDFINALITPYGTNTFTRGESGTTWWLETVYADGSRDRVEFNDSITVPESFIVPQGMATAPQFNSYRNTFYWSRNACALAYGDYTKARIYHWAHAEDMSSASGILESTKEPLESRVYYNYAGQAAAYVVGTNNRPTLVGRVLDDGSTQLYTYAYDGFGHVTNSIDPAGRTFTYIYATNGIDLLEERMTRAGKNELVSRKTYNAQHLPLTNIGADGQTNTYTYNARGQTLTETDPKNETATYTYDTNGYLVAIDGPLPGTNDTVRSTYDAFGRIRTHTDVSGYTVTFDYDALDRLTRTTHPDGTFEESAYKYLDLAAVQDRAGRRTLLEYDAVRQLAKQTDPLGRVTLFQWCSCGNIKSLTDPMGRTTLWRKDVQDRLVSKEYGDGSQVTYVYENTTSRLRQVIDEKLQSTSFAYNRDDTLNSTTYANSAVPTPSVSFSYDPDYVRPTSMTDGSGTTLYQYNPITTPPVLGANRLAAVARPFTNGTIAYTYDELGRRSATTVNGAIATVSFDAAGRITGETNMLGSFTNIYDGPSRRVLSETFPNGQTTTFAYGDVLHDLDLERITYQVGAAPVSEFLYGRDIPADRIMSWSQQAGAQSPNVYSFTYDPADQLLSAAVTNGGVLVTAFAYSYDPASNCLTNESGSITNIATYNALNQLSTCTLSTASRSNEWDAADRLTAVNSGNQRTEFTYDGLGHLLRVRQLLNGSEISQRQFLWSDNEILEERDVSGTVKKRFFEQGVQLETGTNLGSYYYTRDHLGSLRELTDGNGNVRARYAYDPYGRQVKLGGDLDADFGFTGMFWCPEAGLALTRYRAYDAASGRWLSRDPLNNAEAKQGANLYTYAGNNPINVVDPLGLCCEPEKKALDKAKKRAADDCAEYKKDALEACASEYEDYRLLTREAQESCADQLQWADRECKKANADVKPYQVAYDKCMAN
jgi:RHS repeat-associated protein